MSKNIDKYSKTNFTLLPVEYLNPKERKSTIIVDDSVVSSRLTSSPGSQLFTLHVNKAIKGTGFNDSLAIAVRFGFEQFVKPLLHADVFDHYIVFNTRWDNNRAANKDNNDKGFADNVVYQDFPSGLSYRVKDSLLTVKNGVSSPGMRSLTIGGADYKVFSQPVGFSGDRQWIIVGLINGKNYNKEKYQLPVWVVLLLLTAAIGMIVSLPWIKLYHMGNKDKLTVTDGVASVLVSMLLMSLLFFMFFNQNLYVNDCRASTSANALANHISRAFRSELSTAYKTLDKFDIEYNGIRDDIKNLGKDSLTFRNYQDTTCKAILNAGTKKISVDQVYWLDKSGEEISNWTTDTTFTPKSNLSSREYFKRVSHNNLYKFNDTALYVDQIISRTSGVFTSVIAKKSTGNNAVVAAMTFTAKTLNHAVLPDGYQFAIIDAGGEVLYHSLEDRNLNENLKNELADSTELLSCIEAKSDTNFKAEYYGKPYNIKIKPIKDLPYFIVIFEDHEYNDTRDTESYAFTISMLICLLIFLIVQFSVVFFLSSKQSFFKKQLFETSWLGPKESFHQQYNLCIIINIAVVLLLICFYDLRSFLKYFYLILFSITFIAIFSNSVFAIYYKKHNPYNYHFKKIAIGWLWGFVAVIDIIAGYTLSFKNFSLLIFNELVVIIVCVILAYCCLIIYLSKKDILVKAYEFKHKKNFPWTFTHSFALMATTRLIVMSGIPVAFFFIYSFNYEQNLDTRYKQYRFAKALDQKTPADSIKKNVLPVTGVYTDNIFINRFKIAPFTKSKYGETLIFDTISITKANPPHKKAELDSTIVYNKEDSLTVKLLSAFRLHKNNVAVKTNNMNFASIDSEAFFNNLSHEQTNHNDTTTTRTYFKTSSGKYIGLSSSKNIYRTPHRWLFWPLLTLLIACFYYVMHNIIRKLFALGLPLQDGWEDMDELILHDNKLNRLLLIVGPPGSGKLTRLKDELERNPLTPKQKNELVGLKKPDQVKKLNEWEKLLGNDGNLLVYDEDDHSNNNVYVADMIWIPADTDQPDTDWKKCKENALKKSNGLVIINHFEYNIKDSKTNSAKLDFLESLMLQAKSKIMIISTVHPLTFLDSFNDEQRTSLSNKQDADASNTTPASSAISWQSGSITESELERWHVLLGHFRIIIEPLKDYPFEEHNIEHDVLEIENDVLKKSIVEETQRTHYLHGMQKKALSTVPALNKHGIGLPTDSLIFKMQITSHYFYTYIWQSLTKEEKFLLYDLAEDGLVNPYDDYNLSILVYKGLIRRENGTLMLFNRGFRNYILTAIGNTEVERIKAQVKDNGNWGSLKAPLNLAILAILVFLIASQQEAYTKIITYITALGAGVPAVLRIFSLVGTSKSTQKTQ